MKISALLLSSCLIGFPLIGQMVARQGTEADLKQSEFTSPMVVELPLDRLRNQELGDIYPFSDQGKFVCDDVTLPVIVITKSKTWSKQVKLSIKVTAFVRPSYDRKVSIQCMLLDSSEKKVTGAEMEISAKEKQYRSDTASLLIPQSEFDNLLKPDGHPKLKFIVTVASDK
ncbi:MAG: hypothetical protein HY014_18610 [Acidobacteria bacterium]|nr:hypothetical protein [Acidobacteriota bacterium]MBI3490149.1 hypothetical protein [Acidobacteriota bacterium]